MALRLLVLGSCLVAFTGGPWSRQAPAPAKDPFELGLVLKSAREYCRHLEQAALDFVCVEQVTEDLDPSFDRRETRARPKPGAFSDSGTTAYQAPAAAGVPRRESFFGAGITAKTKNSCLYDYQFIRREGKVEEKRILLEKNGHKADAEASPPTVSSFNYSDILLAPVQLLDERCEEYYAYALLGKSRDGDTEAWLLKVTPRLTGVARYLGGTIWLSVARLSILRIEWDPSTFGNFEAVQATAAAYGAEPEVRSYTEFGIEKNGLRFPSADLTEEAYRGADGKLFVRARTSVIYKDYRFFTVETRTTIK